MSDADEGCWFILLCPEALAEAQALTTAWLDETGAAAPVAQRVLLALDELVANLVAYVAPLDAGGVLELRLARAFDTITLTLIDAGPAFDPLAVAAPPPAASLEALAVGGRGLLLVRQLAHAVHYRRADDHNEVTLEFTAAQPAPTVH